MKSPTTIILPPPVLNAKPPLGPSTHPLATRHYRLRRIVPQVICGAGTLRVATAANGSAARASTPNALAVNVVLKFIDNEFLFGKLYS